MDAIERSQQLTKWSHPGPWVPSDSGFVSDAEGYVVCHMTARRGAKQWDWEKNPNTDLIAEARNLVPEMSALLVELLSLVEPSKT